MAELNPQATQLNQIIEKANPHVYGLLSERGKAIFFPRKGILSQSADAASKSINATIGTALEDTGAPMALGTLASQTSLPPRQVFSYAPSSGRPEIRKVWKEMQLKKNPTLEGKSISNPVVTSALTHGLSMCGYLFADPGNQIIIPEYYWENYDLVFCIGYGTSFATYPMFDEQGFNVQGLRDLVTEGAPRKRIVLLNFPNNPTGYTCTESEAQEIVAALVDSAQKGNDIVVLIDDAYFGLVYEDGVLKESLFAQLADAHDRILAVKLDGPTKEDYVWGFRVGFMTFGTKKSSPEMYSALESKLSGAIRGTISNASNIGQSLLTSAYSADEYDEQKHQKYEILKRRYHKIRELLSNHPEYAEVFEAIPCNSGYFMCIKILSGDAEPVRQRLLEAYDAGVIAFGDLMRIAFSSTPFENLDQLFDSIYKAATEIAKG